VEAGDVEAALTAAVVIGDDRLQQQSVNTCAAYRGASLYIFILRTRS
jgi:predicted metalloprotease